MPDYIASVDAGNGGTNAVMVKQGTVSYRTYYLPSVRAAATGDSLGLGTDLEIDYVWVDWRGQRYVVGDDVIRVTRRHLERHMGSNRYGSEFHKFLVAVALAHLGVKKGKVSLNLFAPPSLFNEMKPLMQESFLLNDGKVAITLKGDAKPRTWQYDQVTVWPEGMGAAACFVLDKKGQFVSTDILNGEVLIADLGAFTLDTLRLVDGNFNPETLEHATHHDAGLNTHVRQPVLRQLHTLGEDFTVLTVDDVDAAIRRGLATDDWTVTIAGKVADIGDIVFKMSERYAQWVANNIIDSLFDGLRGIRSLVLVGGGSLLVRNHLADWYGEKVLDPEQHSTTKDISPVDFNAVGGLRLALSRS